MGSAQEGVPLDFTVGESQLEPSGAYVRTEVVTRQVVEHIKSALHPSRPEIQRVSIRNATSGSFRLSLRGELTRPISFDADANEVEASLLELPSVSIVDV